MPGCTLPGEMVSDTTRASASSSSTTTSPTKGCTTTPVKFPAPTASKQQGTNTTTGAPSKIIENEVRPGAPSKIIENEVPSTSTEQQPETTLEPEPKPSKPVVAREGAACSPQEMRRKIEWYFSDANLCQDKALHHMISQKLPEGWICCSEILSRDQLREKGMTPWVLLNCLRKSHLETKVNLTSDELGRAQGIPGEFGSRSVYLRRRQPLPPLLSKDICKDQQFNCDPAQFVLADRHQTMNRLRDQWRVQRQLQLNEVGDDTSVFQELTYGNRPPVVIATGYERIVYGDHGAYIELSSSQVNWKAWPHYFDKRKFNAYFNEYYTRASHSIWEAKWHSWDPNPFKGVLMMYAQSRPVSDRAWAPGAGSGAPHAGRPGGYADYRPGYFYIPCDESLIAVDKQGKCDSHDP